MFFSTYIFFIAIAVFCCKHYKIVFSEGHSFSNAKKKGLSRRHLEGRSTPFREYDPLGVCPRKESQSLAFFLRLTFPRANLRRQIFMTQAEVWAKNWAKCSAHSRASFAVQNDPQIFSQNSSRFITSCLVAENLKFHLPSFSCSFPSQGHKR